MAAEVPVTDVLCEAMEYLSKLGLNLRTRSDNLREKKIRRDKLKTPQCIHKAAKKVLLICELSKRSLENVERGVRTILSTIDTTHTSSKFSENIKPIRDLERNSKYQQFKYQNYTMRICKSVPIKHYMSAKVHLKNMSLSMLDKYPVYYDCKLYRYRKKRKQKSSEHLDVSLDKQKTKKVHTDLDRHTLLKEGNDISKSLSEKSTNKVESWKNIDTANTSKSENDSEITDSQVMTKSQQDISKIKLNTLTDEQKQKDSSDAEPVQSEIPNKQEEIKSKPSCDSDSTTHEKNTVDETRSKKRKHVKMINDDSDDSEKDEPQFNDSEDSCDTQNNYESNNSKTPSKKRKMVESKTIDDSSSNNEEISIQTNNEKGDSKESTRPLIKCVNINKLLKPDIATNLKGTPESNKKSVKIIKCIGLIKMNASETPKIKSDRNLNKGSSYINEKKKAVLAFRPKKFTINVHKLPDFSKKLLHKLKLKRITYKGSVLCKIESDDVCEKYNFDKVKSNLLNDSDSNDNDEFPDRIGKKVKSIVIDESDSENKDNHKDTGQTKDYESSNVNTTEKESHIDDNDKNDLPVENTAENQGCKENNAFTDNNANSNSFREIPIENTVTQQFKDKSNMNEENTSTNSTTSENNSKSAKGNDKNLAKSDEDMNSKQTRDDNVFEGSPHTEYASKISSTNLISVNKEHYSKHPRIEEDSNKSSQQERESLKDTVRDETDSNTNIDKNVNPQSQNTVYNKRCEPKDIEKIKESLLTECDSDDDCLNTKFNNMDETVNKKDTTIDIEKCGIDSKVSKDETVKDRCSLQQNSGTTEDQSNEPGEKEKYDDNLEVMKDNHEHIETNIQDNHTNTKNNSVIQENPEKEESPSKIKSTLMNSSSESQSPDKKTTKVMKSRKKHIRDCMKAKKMLLTYSSSSEDELPRKKTFKGHKKSAVKQLSDELEDIKRNLLEQKKNIEGILCSSSSSEDSTKSIKLYYGRKTRVFNRSESEKDFEKNQDNFDSSSFKMVRSKAKPGSSIGNNSDTQDDKEVDRLTNLETLENSHKGRSPISNTKIEKKDSTEKSTKTSKGHSLIGEELLKAESSGDSHSDEEIDQDLPEMMLVPTVKNGIGHAAKDDLLVDSDSSLAQSGKKSEFTQDDSEEENSVKSKRRKANAISSDSEAGGSTQKDRDVKLSDFEDSEYDSSEPAKRSKRTKKASDSDASASSMDTNKKKRRRIQQINDSDLSDSDGETEGRNKHGRKNIRKVMGKNQLEEATKKAAREEKERIARIAERQKLYNNMEFDESGKPDEVVLEKVVLDFDPETKEPLIEVDRGLVKKLKPHQANGIKFMWDACFESVKRIKKDKGSGCILAHCMGLGKTLQVISLTHTLLTHGSLTGVQRVLVVCPLSTVLNWVNEFRMWLKHAESDMEVDVYELSKNKQNMERASQLNQWFQGGGVCVLGYEMFRNLSADNNKKFKKKMLKSFQESLVDPGPDLVVCDEGHLLKNEKTSLSQSMNKIITRRRIVLTGTPLQNNLKEYYCMVQFVKPNLLGKYNEYLNRFVNPITNGQYTDSTEHDIRVMKRRSHVLHKMLDGAVQRRDYGVLAPFLPPKHEYVLFITLSDVQIKLYQHYLDNYSRKPQPGKSSGFLFPDFQSLQRIWTHPLVLKYNSERYEIMQQKKREREEYDSEGSLVDFIDDDSTPEETSTEESTDDSSDMSDDSRKKSKKKKSTKKNKGKDKISSRRGTRANPVEHEEDDHLNPEVVEVKYENPTEWWIKLVTDDELEDIRNSHKLVLLFDILRQCETIGDKLLVFSQSLYSLDLIEHFLGKVDEATQEGRMDEKLGGHFGSWSPGVDYFRLDGSTSCENRSIWCKNFNREDNPRARLFLISTRAGGLGINLVAANRVVIFDVSWNPSHDVQSIFRVYRFGQKKPCYVYRFLAMGTMEEKIYERQVTKQAISKRVIDEQQIDRHYAENDLAELYKFEPKPDEPRELPALPKDRLFAEMLREHEAQIYKYHEHDSLLENKEEETLTEEERKAAWEDFENEKNKPPPTPFSNVWPMHNGLMPGLLQQQQAAYAMIAAMIRKDMPNVNDNQIRDMLPLLYNSPGLMQKMNDVYKYAQPGMVNPMMSVMNPAAGSGLGGTSGLQYEPPWMRQHRQHMGQQQLMHQQQNSLGAKYYAGGLGSRDPVAMALQQQRAREIMLSGGGVGLQGSGGGGSSRPRGRPPLRTTRSAVTPTATGPLEVVNLDSD